MALESRIRQRSLGPLQLRGLRKSSEAGEGKKNHTGIIDGVLPNSIEQLKVSATRINELGAPPTGPLRDSGELPATTHQENAGSLVADVIDDGSRIANTQPLPGMFSTEMSP